MKEIYASFMKLATIEVSDEDIQACNGDPMVAAESAIEKYAEDNNIDFDDVDWNWDWH